jgi:hypothetical protein
VPLSLAVPTSPSLPTQAVAEDSQEVMEALAAGIDSKIIINPKVKTHHFGILFVSLSTNTNYKI